MDPTLSAQLDASAAGGEPVGAVIALRSDAAGNGAAPASGDEVACLAEDLLDRVGRETGSQARDYNVFRNLGSFVVVASSTFIRVLLEQPEVESAMANRQPGPVVAPVAGGAKP